MKGLIAIFATAIAVGSLYNAAVSALSYDYLWPVMIVSVIFFTASMLVVAIMPNKVFALRLMVFWGLGIVLFKLLLPSFFSVTITPESDMVARVNSVLSLLSDYISENKLYGSSCSEIINRFESDSGIILVDPFGGDIKCKPASDSRILYSYGPDGIDNNGLVSGVNSDNSYYYSSRRLIMPEIHLRLVGWFYIKHSQSMMTDIALIVKKN